MRRILAMLAITGGLGCATEPDTTVLASEAAWIEWPAEVRAATPFEVRLVGYAPGCYPRQDLRIDVQRTAEHVALKTAWIVAGVSDPLCLLDPGFYDTTVTVTGLAATGDRTYTVFTVHPDKPPPRPTATILVRQTGPIDTDRTSGMGQVVGATDIEGCAVMQRPFDSPIPVQNPPAASWSGYVYGDVVTVSVPLCGQTRVFHIAELF